MPNLGVIIQLILAFMIESCRAHNHQSHYCHNKLVEFNAGRQRSNNIPPIPTTCMYTLKKKKKKSSQEILFFFNFHPIRHASKSPVC